MTGKATGRLAAAIALTAALAAGVLAAPVTAATAAAPVADGLTEATAAASCWEIKQAKPQSPSGVYWLATPAMGAAQQFYCDQERNGGGWLLVGRGRDGWGIANAGSGTPEQVRSAVTGPEAFQPRQLSSELIGQLVNNTPIKDLPDGIRLVRATNQQGTTWQDMTFTLASPRADWTWQFNNKQRVAAYKFGTGSTRSGGETRDFGSDSSYNRVRTVTGSTEGWKMGFGFGSQIRGNPSATSYLWSKDTSTGYARPFTQVYIRPKLMSSEVYQPIPDAGTPAVTTTSVVDSFALPQPWSVTGLGAGPQSIEGNNEVAAFTEDNGKVYVGGNFTTVQKTSGGGSAQPQAYLAAFNRDTGEWDPNFRPTFNNAIRALAALPGNRIAVGGFFTEVNGEPRNGLAVIDGTTGALDPQFTGRLINYLSGGFPLVRTLDVQDGWLYVGGSFTHATGGSTTQERYMRAAGRLSVTDGTPDTWNPEFNGTVMSVDASSRGDRVYYAGYFSTSRGRTADKGAALSAVNTDLFTWNVLFSNRTGGRTGYQQAVREVGNRVWLGGSEHSLVSYSRDDFSVTSSTIGNAGGDFQSLADYNGVVYGGCHCFETQYEGETKWPEIGTGWTSADAIFGTGAWSAETGRRIPQFNGAFSTHRGAGSWALMVDSNGTLWQGGDWSYSTRPGYVRQWTSGFTRQGQRDVTAPSTPASLAALRGENGVSLSWSAATDNTAVTGYEVMRDDRVVAKVAGTTVELPAADATARYFVRAVDAQGNKSASTPAVVAQQAPPQPVTVNYVETGGQWQYLFNAAGPSGTWTALDYDTTGWSSGAAPFGWGQASIATPLSAPAPVPYASFYRKAFEVADATRVQSVEITTRADDGVVVYVNGTEVGRKNVAASPAGVNNYATASPSAATALANPVTITVPGELLVTGTNVIAVSVHSGYRSTPSHSFELKAVGTLSPTALRAAAAQVAPPEAAAPEPDPAPDEEAPAEETPAPAPDGGAAPDPGASEGGAPAPEDAGATPAAPEGGTTAPRDPQPLEDTEDPAAFSPAVPPVAGESSPEGWGRSPLIAPAPAAPRLAWKE